MLTDPVNSMIVVILSLERSAFGREDVARAKSVPCKHLQALQVNSLVEVRSVIRDNLADYGSTI